MDTLKLKKAWEVALAPIKSLPMTAIMMYMTGNTLQIFSIMMVFMAFKNPLVGLVGTNQAFERFETDTNRAKMVQVKLAYVAMQLVALAVGVWKVNAMGLLPFVLRFYSKIAWHANTSAGQQGRTGSRGKRKESLWNPLLWLCKHFDRLIAPGYVLKVACYGSSIFNLLGIPRNQRDIWPSHSACQAFSTITTLSRDVLLLYPRRWGLDDASLARR